MNTFLHQPNRRLRGELLGLAQSKTECCLYRRVRRLCVIIWMISLPLRGQTIPDIVPWLTSNNVIWTNPGPSSAQSMPLGNGDIGLNVWVETNGAVDFYIGKSDAWGDSVQGDEGLMKVGGVRLSMNP